MPRSLEPGERHLDHPDGALDDPRSRGDDRVGLLAAQHRLGDLGRVGEVADPHLDDLHTGDRDPLGHLLGELAGDVVGRAAQRHAAGPGVVVRMGGRDVPQRRLGLHLHEVDVVIDGVQRARGVGDLPDDDRGDLDRDCRRRR